MTLTAYLRSAVVGTALALVISAGAWAQRQMFRQYGAKEGLGNLNVKCLIQDHTGFIWVGTDNGLFRYDGGHFQEFGHAEGLPNTEILSLAESPEGVLWVATQGGVVVLTGMRFKPIDVGEIGAFRTVKFDSLGRIYLESTSGIIRGIPDGLGSYRFSMPVHGAAHVMSVAGGDLLFGKDGDLWRLNGDKAREIGLSGGLPFDRWDAVTQDTFGNLWVRSPSRLYELSSGQTRFVDRSEGIPHASVCFLLADSHGRLFVSSMSGMVVLEGVHRALMNSYHGLPADSIGPALIDREESLWLGMDGVGLVRRLGHGEWLSWKRQDGLLHNSVWAIRTDVAGKVWVGTGGGLTILGPHGAVVRSWTSRNGLPGDRVLAIVQGPAGDFYVGTDPAGITHFNKQGMLLRTYRASSGYAASQVITMAIDQQSRLWAMGTGGCFRSRKPLAVTSALQFDRMDVPGIPEHTSFRSVVVGDDGIVWIVTSHGLLRYNGIQWKVFDGRDGLKSSDLAALAVGQGDLWISYRDALGMTRIRFGAERLELTHLTKQDGLSSNEIYAFSFDLNGRLWINTDKGVDVLDRGRVEQHYGTEDGLVWDDTDSLALNVDPQGRVWIGTSGGMSRYTPQPFSAPDAAPPIVLTTIKGVSGEWQTGDKPSLLYSQRSLSIQYAALSYKSESNIRFRYRLTGYETAWNETSERTVRFAALPPGHYVFEVTAEGSNGLWSAVPAKFEFSIQPAWWQSWRFVTACTLLGSLLAYALWHLRVRTLVQQKKRLEKQVGERTAELIESHRQLGEIAYFDMLTRLPNRRMFSKELYSRMALAREPGRSFALLLVDLDFFKKINDTFGHDAGDAVLVETAGRLLAGVRESDCVARLGGDEFAILLSPGYGADAVEAICRRFLDSFAVEIPFRDTILKVECSIGIAMFPEHGDTQERLYKSADLALYQAKRTSRNIYCWHRPETPQLLSAPINTN
jgi:diguanylate cyclase (GGDEF)-like protein